MSHNNFSSSENYDANDFEETLQKFVTCAINELHEQLKANDEEDIRNQKILKDFHLSSSMYSESIDRLLPMNDIGNINVSVTMESKKLDALLNKLRISQLEKYLNSFITIKKSIEEYNSFMKKEIHNYKTKYYNECPNQDLSDFTAIQTDILKLKAEIHQANEQQEQKKTVINKFSECFEISKKINQCKKENEKLRSDITKFRNLPANIIEAEKKLCELKKKFKEVSETFSKEVSNV